MRYLHYNGKARTSLTLWGLLSLAFAVAFIWYSQAADEVPQTPLHFIRNMTNDPALKNDIKVHAPPTVTPALHI